MPDTRTKLPSIPPVPTDVTTQQRTFFAALKEIIEVWKGDRGDVTDAVLTFRSLLGDVNTVLGVDPITKKPVVTSIGGSGSTGTTSGTPPDVGGLIASGTFSDIILTWDAKPNTYDGFAFTEIYRADTDTLAAKVLIGTTRADIYVDSCGEGGDYYYWARHVSTLDETSNFVLHGVHGQTNSLSGNYITDGTISDAKIGTLNVAKLRSGTVAVGETLTVGSGPNRIIIDSYGNIRVGATGYGTGSGFWVGETAGNTALFLGDPTTNYMSWNGVDLTIQTPYLTLSSGNAVFSGALQAATGTFIGALQAATGTFSGALQAATGTFSGHLEAATGTFGGQLLAGVIDFSAFEGTTAKYFIPGAYTVTVPSDKTSMRVTLVGGSGGGGGAGNVNGGGGGGGGSSGAIVSTFHGLTAGATYSLTVGAKGIKGVRAPHSGSFLNAGSDGTDGGDTLISGLISSLGGKGGKGFNPYTMPYPTGASGGIAGTNGNVGASGGPYYAVLSAGSSYPANVGQGGQGGLTTTGRAGGKGGDARTYLDTALDGQDGFAYIEFFNPNSVVLQTTYNALITKLQQQGIQTP